MPIIVPFIPNSLTSHSIIAQWDLIVPRYKWIIQDMEPDQTLLNSWITPMPLLPTVIYHHLLCKTKLIYCRWIFSFCSNLSVISRINSPKRLKRISRASQRPKMMTKQRPKFDQPIYVRLGLLGTAVILPSLIKSVIYVALRYRAGRPCSSWAASCAAGCAPEFYNARQWGNRCIMRVGVYLRPG